MDGLVPGDSSQHVSYEDGPYNNPDEPGSWYLSRKDIEENSPSKRDGIDLKKETYLRKSYCTFLQDLGMRLKVPQVTIATAIIFCHRFFLRHSHATNDRRTIATVCMFLAGKVEETPRPLKDVIMVSYEIIHKKDPAAVQRIKQKEVYEQQKELILTGERLVLATLAFDLNVHHPYKPLVEAIKKFKVAQNALAQVAWNFVNDGLRTSLCLQFKPHHIAAGAIFLAAKFLKVKLPSDGERIWWQEFGVTPHQLEDVSNQMLELYEQNRMPPSQGSEVEVSTGGCAPSHRDPSRAPTVNEEHVTSTVLKPGTSKPTSSHADTHGGVPRVSRSGSYEHGNTEAKSTLNQADENIQDDQQVSQFKENKGEPQNNLKSGSEGFDEDQQRNIAKNKIRETGKLNENTLNQKIELKEIISQSPRDAIKKIDKDKVKAALEKRRKNRGDMNKKMDNLDDDDLIERELEDGIELAADSEKITRERRQSWPKPSIKSEENLFPSKHQGLDIENVEEGEVSAVDDTGHAPKSSNRKRKAGNSPENMHKPHHNHHDYNENRLDYSERDHKRHLQENHV